MTTPPPLGDHAQQLKLGPELRRISQVWVEKGITLCRLGRYDEALAAFEKSLAVSSRNARAWYNKGLTLASLGRLAEAVSAYDVALNLDDAHPFIWLQKGIALAALGSHDAALAALDRALAFDPDDAVAWQHRGGILFKLGRYEEALAAYDRTLGLEEDRTVIWKAKGAAVKVPLPAEERTLRLGPGWLALPDASPTDHGSSPNATRPATPLPPRLAANMVPAAEPAAAPPSPGTGAVAKDGVSAPAADHAPQAALESAPERPCLAAGVELHGQIKESGFEQAQWLVERDGRFIQLSELLYRVVERCDGQHTLDEIAEGVRAATCRNLSAENIRYLLVTRLIPTRLVDDAAGSGRAHG